MTILVIDDEKPTRQYVVMMAKNCSEADDTILEQKNAANILDLITDHHPDLVLLDISMPVMDGIEALDLIMRVRPETQVVLLTCHDDFEKVRDAMRLGARDYILKDELTPGKMRELLQISRRSVSGAEKTTFSEKAADTGEQTASSDIIVEAVRYISKNYMNDLSTNMLANQLFVNPDYFGKKFKKETGVSFAEYLQKYRLNKAKNLLIYTEMPVSQISDRVGFRSDSYFSQSFRKIFGCTPMEFRKKYH